MNVLIVDDEMLARKLTREYLASHTDLQIVGECDNGADAVLAILTLQPDLVFLDIQMPRMSGLEVLQATDRKSGVIFTTAFDEYALQAFDLHAVDYLLKPFSQERFDAALLRARKLQGKSEQGVVELVAQTRLHRIAVRDRNQLQWIAVDDVEFIEAQDDYILIHAAGKSIMKTQALSDIEKQLDPARFVRVHRSYLINIDKLDHIERVSKDSLHALMRGGAQVPVSRSGNDRIRQQMNDQAQSDKR
jgi:two-component system LytT family response regulator